VELDSATIVMMLTRNKATSEPLVVLMLDCVALLHKFQSHDISHIYREGNKAADFLAELGHHGRQGTTILQDPPRELQHILSGDKSGSFFPRFLFLSFLSFLF